MGAELVKSATVYVLPLLGRHHKARVTLLVMAVIALDKDDRPRYFGGYWHIAKALGLYGTPASKRTAVSRVWRTLVDLGCIEQANELERRRSTTSWILLVDDWPYLAQTREPP